MARVVRTFRGISVRAARMYLAGLGGEVIDAQTVEGPNWSAGLDDDTVQIGPTLQITEVELTVDGDDDAVEELVEAFAQKAMRAGG